ncbi:hypothetical protein [Accumulibacter sp.]|uniref:hypothetical protein n=1 Tax=Accumulibacter sp. TaxID=2053492 RepID=UPI001A4E8071|nr:hypothetical protein [Accumulibacter sp.]MBL8375871.1 hypothetical protein [Accumulibacter sp.]
MAEISSVEAVRAKLREFDRQISDAIAAAKALAAIRADADILVGKVGDLTVRGEKEIQSLNQIKSTLRESRNEFASLHQELVESIAESKNARQQLESTRASVVLSIDGKVAQAERRLLSATQMQFSEQEKVLTRLDADTRTNAQLAAKASASASKDAGQLQHLLLTLRTDLQDKSESEFSRVEQLLESKFKELQGDYDRGIQSAFQMLEASSASSQQLVRTEASALRNEQQDFLASIDRHVHTTLDGIQLQSSSHADAMNAELAAFKDEVAVALRGQNESMSRQVTDFLNKQNALIQNLTQQIDGFQRAASAQSAAHSETRSKMGELATALRRFQDTAADQFETSRLEFASMRSTLDEMKIALQKEAEKGERHGATVQALSILLDETLMKLKKLPFVGSNFQ